jgi:putative Ca2+/H+ antiporter (TMEM165/GDT1 family)
MYNGFCRVAEIGDKTQIIALALAAEYDAITSLVAGTTLGMMIVNVPTVLFAERATKWIPVKMVRIVAAIIYAILGVLTLTGYSRMRLWAVQAQQQPAT